MKHIFPVISLVSLATTCTSSSSTVGSSETPSRERHRQVLEKIADYQPDTLVRSDNAIDLDVHEMETQFSSGGTTGFFSAFVIYTHGAHSQPVAEIKVMNTGGLPTPMAMGDKVIGWNAAKNREVVAYAADNYPAGTTNVRLNYDTKETEGSSTVNWCQVGGMPVPYLDNCLAESGNLVVSGFSQKLVYTYDLFTGNVNDQTIQSFSTKARDDMFLCENCPYEDFEKFYNYYGVWDYADQFVMAAEKGTQTAEFQRGTTNFSGMNMEGRGQAILSASVYLSIFMRVIREMERALDNCSLGLEVDSTSGVKSWDSAVALYTGSLEGPTGDGNGVLLYNLADQRCMDFRTCGITGDDATTGRSYVNMLVFQEFRDGQRKLRQGDCKGPRKNKERIVQLMRVPLIQSTLLYAWKQSNGGDANEATEAIGATLAASVLPFIHACGEDGPSDAETIHSYLTVDHDATEFEPIKRALERNYKCLNISCADVGGYWDAESQQFVEGAGPCVDISGNNSTDDGEINEGLAVGIALGGLAVIGLLVWMFNRRSEKLLTLNASTSAFNRDVPELS